MTPITREVTIQWKSDGESFDVKYPNGAVKTHSAAAAEYWNTTPPRPAQPGDILAFKDDPDGLVLFELLEMTAPYIGWMICIQNFRADTSSCPPLSVRSVNVTNVDIVLTNKEKWVNGFVSCP